MGVILRDFGAYKLWKMEQQDLEDFTKFVLRIYYEHHLNIQAPIEEVEACIKEDKRLYKYSYFYALKTEEGKTFGTVNASLWNGKVLTYIPRQPFVHTRHAKLQPLQLINRHRADLQ